MCNPVAIVGIALTVASGLYAADAQKQAGRAAVMVAERNAETDRQRGEMATRIGAVAEDRHRAKVRQMLGSQRANLAAKGIDPDSGTALALQDETVSFGETDAMTIRYNAAREAWGFGVSANNYDTQAAVTRATTKNNVTGTYLTTTANAFTMAGGAMGGRASAASNTSRATMASGMTYSAPATSSGASWMTGYR